MNKSVIVVGAGVVGLACGKELSEKGYEVFIAEQEKNIATQTSARNSGVIHAGVYYPAESLKAKLCIRGKQLLYEYCEQFEVPYSRTKKMIVATTIVVKLTTCVICYVRCTKHTTTHVQFEFIVTTCCKWIYHLMAITTNCPKQWLCSMVFVFLWKWIVYQF